MENQTPAAGSDLSALACWASALSNNVSQDKKTKSSSNKYNKIMCKELRQQNILQKKANELQKQVVQEQKEANKLQKYALIYQQQQLALKIATARYKFNDYSDEADYEKKGLLSVPELPFLTPQVQIPQDFSVRQDFSVKKDLKKANAYKSKSKK